MSGSSTISKRKSGISGGVAGVLFISAPRRDSCGGYSEIHRLVQVVLKQGLAKTRSVNGLSARSMR